LYTKTHPDLFPEVSMDLEKNHGWAFIQKVVLKDLIATAKAMDGKKNRMWNIIF
jgi:hypothetical protein